MPIPARTIRRNCDEIEGQRPHLSFKDQDRRVRILDAAQMVMARHGAGSIRLSEFALGLRMAPITIRRHFPDMDNLLAEILRRHLQAIIRAIGAVAPNPLNRQAARRGAYLAATRTPLGAPTEAHLLLIRDRHLLPQDEREPIEALRLSIGEILAGPHAQTALALLDTPELAGHEIESALAAITRPAPIRPASRPYQMHQPPLGQPPLGQATPGHRTLPDPRAAQRPRAGPH